MATPFTQEMQQERAMGALLGCALGDALGMPTQSCSPHEILETYGEISDFVAPVDGHPIAHGLIAASITDDTEQTVLLAEHLLKSPAAFDELGWARRLVEWEASVKERGLHDLLGPSTKRAIKALLDGASPEETGLSGDTNGAAMRICPVGIVMPLEDPAALTEFVATTCRITHNTVEAIASAAAVAAAISAGVGGANVEEAADAALMAAKTVESRMGGEAGIARRIALAFDIADACDSASLPAAIRERIGTSVASTESIPAAFALFRFTRGNGWNTGLLAANLGGDTDTIGAIACAMCGAVHGAGSFPKDKTARLVAVNNLNFDAITRNLLTLRRGRESEARILMGQAT
ncbi:MAG: ADP-ribosylglycohydrolase family protein [Alphaproteobacteria bacterium]|nr:ADP-ribosylglycohydrolase family protein [Alphaproteobacteria bacterium]